MQLNFYEVLIKLNLHKLNFVIKFLMSNIVDHVKLHFLISSNQQQLDYEMKREEKCEKFLHTFTIKTCTHKNPVGSGIIM
jgi:hypothetical protein